MDLPNQTTENTPELHREVMLPMRSEVVGPLRAMAWLATGYLALYCIFTLIALIELGLAQPLALPAGVVLD